MTAWARTRVEAKRVVERMYKPGDIRKKGRLFWEKEAKIT
jgi:hypothetical protein